ncbi:DUF5615 family PIN-like protein [Hymenobacter sp. BT507]|uniref:DUF5615 family PIN-like protein n=1 Tax=Hymenobacter citatus TaxID=2763506 RepID=A0ABR7MMH8_9BACT|nr:DUF5615 family PIN-like protein [Hymenobacter citatus]
MRYLIDANLPHRFAIWHSVKYEFVPDTTWSDSQIWAYAMERRQTIITKDADFADRVVRAGTPPKVIRLCIGNMRRNQLWLLLEKIRPSVLEASEQPGVRLTLVFTDRIETY